jgi:hypothetical protein
MLAHAIVPPAEPTIANVNACLICERVALAKEGGVAAVSPHDARRSQRTIAITRIVIHYRQFVDTDRGRVA